MKKLLIFVLCVSLCALSACNGGNKPNVSQETTTPEDAALAEIIAALDAELNTVITKEFVEGSFVASCPFAKEDPEMYAALFAKFKFTIGEGQIIDETTATVEVTVSMPDIGAALMQYMTEATAHANEENWDEDFSAFYDILSSDDAKIATNTVTVTMTKGENGWAISHENNGALKDALSGSLNSTGFLS